MLKIVLGVVFKVLKKVFEKAAKSSQNAETKCAKINDKCKRKSRNKKE
jgi:hypothetical protein